MKLVFRLGIVFLALTGAHAFAESATSQSGYDKLESFGGPDGVTQQLKEADLAVKTRFEWEAPGRFFKPWYDWKTDLKNEKGLALGVFASFLGQAASDTTTGSDTAAGGIYRFNGSWTLRDNGSKDWGRIEWRLEARSKLGNAQPPNDLSNGVGVAALNTAFAYSERFTTDLSVLNWAQAFRDGTVGYAVGRFAFDVYLDAMPFQTVSGGFLNRSFILNPTIGTTGIGALGAVGKAMVTDNIIIGLQIYDGNAANGDWDFDTVQEHEYLKAVDVAWVPSYARRKLSKIQFTYWDKDAREKAGVDEGRGWAVSASWEFGDRLLPFIRFGSSNGGAGVAAEDALSGGFRYTVSSAQQWTLGAGWAQPNTRTNGDDVKDEYVIETSYNFQIAKNISIMPDIQLLIDPANNPDKDKVWVGSLRAIVTF